jgi:uncharacterized damage-inducible protein DinB
LVIVLTRLMGMASEANRQLPEGMGDERAVLLGWLAWQRATVHRKCQGLSDELARRTVRPESATSISAVVSHLAWTERHWFERSFAGQEPPDALPHVAESSGWDYGGATLAHLLANYAAQCERSDAIIAAHSLDELEAYVPEGNSVVSLRWIVCHMIEETARHLGHLDTLRERADGVTGY